MDEVRRAAWVASRLGVGVLLLCAAAATASAASLLPSMAHVDITASSGFWVDSAGDANYAQAAAAAYRPIASSVFHLGLQYRPVWVRLTIENPGPARHYVLDCVNPRISHVDLYEATPSGLPHVRRGGQAVPYFEREFARPSTAFTLALGENESRVVHLRLQNSGIIRARFVVWNADAFQARLGVEPVPHALTIGMLFAMVLYHLLVAGSLRERGYLYLALFAMLFILYYLAVTGYGPLYLWANSGVLSTRASSVMGFLTVASGLLFSHALLDAGRTVPRHGRLIIVLAVVAALGAALRGVSDHPAVMYLLYALGLCCPLVPMSAAVLAQRRGSRTARTFLLTWSTVLGATLVIALEGLHLVSIPLPIDRYFVVLFVAAVILWSLSLTDRIKTREREAREMLEREVKTLSGLLPICSHCKSIRDDQGYWKRIEHYLESHTDADLSHSICPECLAHLYPEYTRMRAEKAPPAG